jgi:hypothetical protein
MASKAEAERLAFREGQEAARYEIAHPDEPPTRLNPYPPKTKTKYSWSSGYNLAKWEANNAKSA